jgi:hypothetical protein
MVDRQDSGTSLQLSFESAGLLHCEALLGLSLAEALLFS